MAVKHGRLRQKTPAASTGQKQRWLEALAQDRVGWVDAIEKSRRHRPTHVNMERTLNKEDIQPT